MLWQHLQQQTVELGWSFYGPVLLFAALCLLGVPVWASIGAASIAMLIWTEVLPLSLLGESLFDGIDAFALTAVPLFILTGDVPSPTNPPKGCAFSTRCPKVFDRCRIETPPLRDIGEGRFAACHLVEQPDAPGLRRKKDSMEEQK